MDEKKEEYRKNRLRLETAHYGRGLRLHAPRRDGLPRRVHCYQLLESRYMELVRIATGEETLTALQSAFERPSLAAGVSKDP